MTAISSFWPLVPQTLVPKQPYSYTVWWLPLKSDNFFAHTLWHCHFPDRIWQAPDATFRSGTGAWKATGGLLECASFLVNHSATWSPTELPPMIGA